MSDELQSGAFRLVVGAGGTGGHIYPAIAVVESLREILGNKLDVEFLGSEDRLETTIVPSLGYRLTSMPIQGFKGIFSLSTFSLPFRIIKSIGIARSLIKSFRPHCVLCTGAYISYPVGKAAAMEGVPLIIMESNTNLGKTNSRLAKHASRIVLSFEESMKHVPPKAQRKAIVLGNPVRSQISFHQNTAESRFKMNLREDIPTILVFGGSLGARSINNAIQDMIETFAKDKLRREIQIIWQTGRNFKPNVPPEIQYLIRTMPFIDDMDSAYGSADLVVSRSGATTIAELGVAAKPAILVPLPSASMNEQYLNARIAEEKGAAVLVHDVDTKERLPGVIKELLDDTLRRVSMSNAMKKIGRQHSAHDVAQLVIETGSRVQSGVRT